MEALNVILEKQIVIVEAPVGYGKSVTVRAFLAAKPVEVIWISLLETGADRMWDEMNHQFYERFPQIKDMLAASRPFEELTLPERIRQLSMQSRQLPLTRPVVIVIDDYQLANTVENSRMIESIARGHLHNIHIVFLTRDVFCGNRNLLQLKGEVSVIPQEIFRISKDEIKKGFASHNIQLSDRELDHMDQLCEGWIAPLRLFVVDYDRIGVFSVPIAVYDLIRNQFYMPLSADIQDFLCAVCPFGQFTLEQAEYVWHRRGAEAAAGFLRFLRQNNAFLYYDEREHIFRLHNLIRNYLVWELIHRSPEERVHVLRSCGCWFAREHSYWTALDYFSQINDYHMILKTLNQDLMASATFENWPRLCEQTSGCPEHMFMEYPKVLFLIRLMAYFHGDRSTAAYYRRLSAELIRQTDSSDERLRELVELDELIRGIECYNDLELMAKHFHNFNQVQPIPFLQDEIVWTMGCPSVLMMFHRQMGQLHHDISQFQEEQVIYRQIADGHGSGAGALMEAEACLNRGELLQAQTLAHEAIASANRYHQLSNICIARFILLRCAVLNEDREQIQKLSEDIRTMAQNDTTLHHMIRNMVEISIGFLHATSGHLSQIPPWLREGTDIRNHAYLFAWPVCQLVYGRYLLGTEDYLKLTGVFRCLIKEPEYSRHAMFLIYSGIYIAIASERLGYGWDATEILRETLDLATSDQLYLPFAESFRMAPELYQNLALLPTYQEAVAMIRQMSGQLERGLKYFYESSRPTLAKSVLTEREKEMARLAFDGMTNQEIGDQLFITASTVKRALVNIYRKLNIHGRAELSGRREHFQ